MYWMAALLVFLLDQSTKWLVQLKMTPFQSIKIGGDWFCLTYAKNYGAAFSIMDGYTPLLIIISAIVFILVWLNRHRLSAYPGLFRWGLAVGLGGAAGNLADRIRLGYVVDFLDFRFWPVFNLADTGIVIGVGLILAGLIISEYRGRTKDAEPVKAGTAEDRL